jgi:hypothetical protein
MRQNKKPADLPGLSILKAGSTPVNVTKAVWSSLGNWNGFCTRYAKLTGQPGSAVSNDILFRETFHRFAIRTEDSTSLRSSLQGSDVTPAHSRNSRW